MENETLNDIFTKDDLEKLFPIDRADRFFESLFGDAAEGAFDIRLKFKEQRDDRLNFEFQLRQRPGKCLACNLTYGLPQVFFRHPVININGLVQEIDQLLNRKSRCSRWELGSTFELSNELHVIPFTVFLEDIP